MFYVVVHLLRIVEYPGFNVAVPPGVVDVSNHSLGYFTLMITFYSETYNGNKQSKLKKKV